MDSQSFTRSKRPAILISTENLRVGGAEKYTVLVANELFRRGFRVIVLANDGPFRSHFSPGIRFVPSFFEHGLFGVIFAAFQMIVISAQEHIALIHAQKLESNKAAWLTKLLTGIPVVKTVHGYTKKELVTVGPKINRYSNAVIAVVNWIQSELEHTGVAPEKITLIHNGIPPFKETLSETERDTLKKDLGITGSDRVILSMARLEKGKNYAALLEWFANIVKEVPNAKLLIVGSGPEEVSLEKEREMLGLHSRIVFVPATTNVGQYLQIADVFCTPTVGRGMAVLEAMAAGLPVVGIEPVGEPLVVEDGITGYLVPKDNGVLFAQRITQLLLNPALARSLGEAAKTRATNLFSLSGMVDKLETVYSQFTKLIS